LEATPHGELQPDLLLAIAKLPDRQRWVLVYRVILDLSTETTASFLEIEPGTVTTHLRRALQSLRNALSELRERQVL
jgi:DNA-directed RNA polymerase specialized sigma24 family protein